MALQIGINSYCDKAFADEYCAEMGLAVLSSDNYLIQATRAIDRLYGSAFIGYRAKNNTDQKLCWPRTSTNIANNFYESGANWIYDAAGTYRDINQIQPELKEAVVELAVLLAGGLDPYKHIDSIKSESIKIGDGVTQSTTYAYGFVPNDLSKVEMILRPLLENSYGIIKVTR